MRVTTKRPNHAKFSPALTDEDGYMILPENCNKNKEFSMRILSMIYKRIDGTRG